MVPIALGDNHLGYRVIGTTNDYFEHYRYRNKQALEFEAGGRFEDLFDVVIGAEIAEQLGYGLGAEVIVTHGIGEIGGEDHDNLPFAVSGILKRTGTPVDRSVHVSLEALEALHLGWGSDGEVFNFQLDPEQARQADLTPRTVTAALIGTRSRFAVFEVQRFINRFEGEL